MLKLVYCLTGSPKSKSSTVNPIAQLIARKRAQLVKLAQNSHLGVKRKHKRKKSKDSNSGSDSADSGTASSSRRRYQPHKRAYSSCFSSSTSSDEDNEQMAEQLRHLYKKGKKFRSLILDSSSENGDAVSEHETVTSNNNNHNNNNNNNIVKEPSTSSETPDSGIAISERPTSSRIKSRSHRNYRKRTHESDSE